MKLLKYLTLNDYNNVDLMINYLRGNPTINDNYDKPIEYYHCYWKGTLSELHLMCLQSLLNVNPNAQIILWTPNLFELNGSNSALKIKKYFKNNIRIEQIDKNLFNNADAELLYSKYQLLSNQTDQSSLAYSSDIIRFVILQVYGGLWFDLDILFIRDFNSIKIKRYVSQWGTGDCGNAAIMRLERNHNLIKQIFNKYEQPFYPTTTFKLDNNLDITILPSTFFDILWRPENEIPNHLQFKTFDDFFNIKEFNLPKELYAYHWHNRWNNELPSFYFPK